MNRFRHALSILSTMPYRLLPVNRDLKYHFIHIPKNAGSSIRDALRWRKDVSLSDPKHYRYVDIADEVGRHLNFFAVVRNPWSRTASRYRYAIKNARRWRDDDPRKLYIESVTFEQFVMDRKIIGIPAFPEQPWMGPLNSWFNQLDWVRDEDGEVQCACLRLEELNRDLNDYFKSKLILPRRNVDAASYDYRDMYSDELIEVVADYFRDDIDYFGFSFEGPATRNVRAAS